MLRIGQQQTSPLLANHSMKLARPGLGTGPRDVLQQTVLRPLEIVGYFDL